MHRTRKMGWYLQIGINSRVIEFYSLEPGTIAYPSVYHVRRNVEAQMAVLIDEQSEKTAHQNFSCGHARRAQHAPVLQRCKNLRDKKFQLLSSIKNRKPRNTARIQLIHQYATSVERP
jgi:hypothetical protein